jgi:hypothetical protein
MHFERPGVGDGQRPLHDRLLELHRRTRPEPEEDAVRHRSLRIGVVEPDPAKHVVPGGRELPILAELLDHADDAHDPRRVSPGCRFGLGIPLLRDDLSNGVRVAEDLVGQPLVEHHRRPASGRVVLPREPPSGRQRDAEHLEVAVGDGVQTVADTAPAGKTNAAAPAGVRVRPGEPCRRDLDLRHLAQSHQQLAVGLAVACLYRRVRVGFLTVDLQAPDTIDLVAERSTGVAGVVQPDQDDAEQGQEGEKDLDSQQEVLPLAVPDQPEQVPRHRDNPPFSASTGLSRDIRHAG